MLTLDSSLAPDDVPMKLRCAVCSKLAINAFRLPCCEQSICENCRFYTLRKLQDAADHVPGQSNLPSSCPICEHSPLSAEDCNPNKSLRTTIKVFLRTAEKKRNDAIKAKDAKEAELQAGTPVEPIQVSESVPATDAVEEVAPAQMFGADEPEKQTNEDPQAAREVHQEQSASAEKVCCTKAIVVFRTNCCSLRITLPKTKPRTLETLSKVIKTPAWS